MRAQGQIYTDKTWRGRGARTGTLSRAGPGQREAQWENDKGRTRVVGGTAGSEEIGSAFYLQICCFSFFGGHVLARHGREFHQVFSADDSLSLGLRLFLMFKLTKRKPVVPPKCERVADSMHCALFAMLSMADHWSIKC